MESIKNTFKNDKALVGMIHLLPMIGYEGHTNIQDTLKTAISDLNVLQEAGFDGFIVENNYDLPHDIFIDDLVKKDFKLISTELHRLATIPMGICVLWNDFYAALDIAKVSNALFVRVPVFVDNVRTSYGDIYGTPEKVINYRKEIDAENVQIFTDIQVKHSELLNVRPINESAIEAIKKGSNGLIVTGKWTGDAPKTDDLKEVREAAKDVPLIIGSGATVDNLSVLLEYADVVVVGTAIKSGKYLSKEENVNLKPYSDRLDLEKAKLFAKKFAEYI